MSANVGSQTVTLIYYSPADVELVNNRSKEIQPTGIYKGGYLTVVDGSHCQLSPLVCEISDGTYQVKIETGATVNIAVASATPYVVLRWVHDLAVQSNDYMDFVATATPATNDLVVAKCLFTGATLTGFDYGDTAYTRSFPKQPRLYLQVESTGESELRVRIRSGFVQGNASSIFVPEQKSSSIVAPITSNKIYLVCVDPDTGIISVDSTGAEVVTPVAPDYAGRLVLAEITLAVGATSIPDSRIKDVRAFLTPSRPPTDDVTLEYAIGVLQIRRLPIATLPRYTMKWKSGSVWSSPTSFSAVSQTGSQISLGSIIWGAGNTTANSSTLFTMTVNNSTGIARAITQLLGWSDDKAYFWLNGVQIDSCTTIGNANKTVTWNLLPGDNLIQIILVDQNVSQPGVAEMALLGDFVDDTHVTFVS